MCLFRVTGTVGELASPFIKRGLFTPTEIRLNLGKTRLSLFLLCKHIQIITAIVLLIIFLTFFLLKKQSKL